MTRTNLYSKNSNMLERFVIEGVWYVNDMSISDGIFGQLNYSPEKIILELKGSFTNSLIADRIENTTIYGFSTDGNYILLENCFIVNQSNNFPGITILEYNIQTIFISESEVNHSILENIKKFTISFEEYENWNTSSAIQLLRPPVDSELISIQYSRDSLKEIQKEYFLENSNLKMTEFADIKSDFKNSLSDLTILQKKYLSFEHSDSTTFNYGEAMEHIGFINQLYSFLLNNILNYKEFCLHITTPSTQDLQKVQVYFHQRIAATNSRYLINYNEIEDIFPRLLNEFDTLYSKLEKILSGHLNSSFKNFFEVDDFLQAARNLEVFSRNFHNVESNLPDNYSQTKETLLENLNQVEDPNLIRFFENKITFIGEISLNKKLKILIQSIPQELKIGLFKLPNKSPSDSINKFCQTVADTRNYYTHGDTISKYDNAINDMKELHTIYMKMRCLMDILILKTLTIDEEKIINTIKRWDGPYQQLFFN
ncbi:hypothetical protein H318_14813 [Enterococcus durans IPLA 655]|uniref:HEPN domain-containing protein n=1 Tax=Enterococcus durans TaxID=53345 RepID=UPI0003284246|nr:HEPN domain-containing protein [Enterococcus durans]EMS74347.1 hypothetical protein H318_14813 [Enterococcus durans IPLA 655]